MSWRGMKHTPQINAGLQIHVLQQLWKDFFRDRGKQLQSDVVEELETQKSVYSNACMETQQTVTRKNRSTLM